MKIKVYKIIRTLFITGIVLLLCLTLTNIHIINSQKNKIYDVNSISEIQEEYDCIIVLGAGVRPDGTPSDMLLDRLKTGVLAYNSGVSSKIIMSGDHGRKDYDEVNTMKNYALNNGIASVDVFMDHAGFSTYDSMYRARDIFDVKKAVVVTQKYHLYRALYLAESMGIDCIGLSADLNKYRNQESRELREIVARSKDFLSSIFKPKPKYLGDKISVFGDGNVTNDL